MAYNPNPPRAEYISAAGQTVFPFVFKIFLGTDIIVWLTPSGDDPDDIADILILDTNYTVAINGDAGGEITLLSAGSLGDSVTLVRELPIVRDIDYQTGGDALADTFDLDQDYQTYLVADNAAVSERALVIAASAQGVDTTVPAPVSLNFLQWNPGATALINVSSLQADGFLWTAADVYTKTETDNLLNDKADQATTYTKTEVDTAISLKATGTRQTVQFSSVDANGFPDYISIGTGLEVNIAATSVNVIINASNGNPDNDRVGLIDTNASISGLTDAATNYLYADIAADGVVTLGSTILAPVYQFGGVFSASNNQATFNISEMTMKVGDGGTANQTYRVFIGEAVTAGGIVTSVVNYALNGYYESAWISTVPAGSRVSFNSNIGTDNTRKPQLQLKNLTPDLNYSVGDITEPLAISASWVAFTLDKTKLTIGAYFTSPTGSRNKTTGANAAITASSWAYKFSIDRGW